MVAGAWICLLAPLVACLAVLAGGDALPRRAAGWIATLGTFVGFGGAVASFAVALSRDGADRAVVSTAWNWLVAGDARAGLSILVDPLSLMMMLVVTGVGGLIVMYSIGYMDADPEERRFFAYMSLFVFSMLVLVQGGNLLMLLVGWGLVGLSSYLLIGFWHHRPSAVAAAKKAFVMNAFGDATMALALFAILQHTGTLDFQLSFERMEGQGGWLTTLVALGLLGGAVAKSAQIPLQTWLPDAMEGPTPVSALIHAATMVTAGVYLIVRTHPLFELAPAIQDLAAVLGAVTLLVAGLVALVQTDIKRVIAYSTMSQIGYMFLGVGLGAYSNGMFHLMTHAFFKALLFMAAGVVIHALAGEQDIRRMGGLARRMPKTFWATMAGGLALVGFPATSGFFSKDSILAAALDHGVLGWILWSAGLAGAFLTGLYTFRMIFVVFGGEESDFVRANLFAHHAHADTGHAHELAPNEPGDEPQATHADAGAHRGEGPWTMTAPVAVLAVLALVGGFLQFAPFWHPLNDWLHSVAIPMTEPTSWMEAISSAAAVVLGLAGMLVAWLVYADRRRAAPKPALALERKLFFDDLYDAVFYWPAVGLSKVLAFVGERGLSGAGTMGFAEGFRDLGLEARRLQTGLVRSYVLLLAAGVAVLLVVFVAVR